MEQLDASQDSEVALATEDSGSEVVDTSTSPDDIVSDASPESLLEPENDDEEIDYDGEKYKVPKKLREAFLRQQDYTQKTQAVAEQRKAVEAQAAEIQQRSAAQQQSIAEYAEAYSLDSQLQQFAQINWPDLIDSDPVQALKLDRQMRDLQARRDQVVASVTQKQQTQHFQAQQEIAKRLQEGRAVLEREIQGWSPDTAKALASYGQEFGFAPEELAQVSDPRQVKILHKAWQFDQLMKQKAPAKDKPAPQEKPVTRITASKGTATKDPSKMTDAEFAAMRRRQIAQR